MENNAHDYYTPSEISKMQIDKEIAEAYEMNKRIDNCISIAKFYGY